MNRAVLEACMPWLAVLGVLFAVAYLLARLGGGRLRLSRLRDLHQDQEGAAQSLSFVLTLPFFMMFILLIIQVSQIMIATVVVHYAAFAAARAAVVWIPQRVSGTLEYENCIGTVPRVVDQTTANTFPETDPASASYGPGTGGVTYIVSPCPADVTGVAGSPKLNKILSAAVLACMPIAPLRGMNMKKKENDKDQWLQVPGGIAVDSNLLTAAYEAIMTKPTGRPKNASRLQNKLAWSANQTAVEVRYYHQNEQPDVPLMEAAYPCFPYVNDPIVEPPPARVGMSWRHICLPFSEFQPNEVGWQDTIMVTVHHNLALLPGAGRLLKLIDFLSHAVPNGMLGDVLEISPTAYALPITAKAAMNNEGDKSVVPYAYTAN